MRISDWSSDVCSSDLEGLAHLFYVRKSRAYLVSCKLLIVTGLKIVQIVRHGRTEATTAEPASHQPDPRADGRFRVAAGARHLQDVDPRLCPARLARTRLTPYSSTCDHAWRDGRAAPGTGGDFGASGRLGILLLPRPHPTRDHPTTAI